MANEIKSLFGSVTTMTITLTSLGNLLEQQSTVIDNTTDRFTAIILYIKVRNGTSPNSDAPVNIYLIRHDAVSETMNTDGSGSSDATIVVKNAHLIGTLTTGPSAASNSDMEGDFVIHMPGPVWGIIVENLTGVALNATASEHVVKFVGVNPEVQ